MENASNSRRFPVLSFSLFVAMERGCVQSISRSTLNNTMS